MVRRFQRSNSFEKINKSVIEIGEWIGAKLSVMAGGVAAVRRSSLRVNFLRAGLGLDA